ncbi:FAD:protein FMN transferase [Luteococcus peritonei]|uniref:FAD:protein FMN transferase n=1 Tax=Luteococcus peritonei TaxID=88874 RepID=A0ABW4RRM6_9ACTN
MSRTEGFSQGLYQPVMGTDLRIQVWAQNQSAAETGEQVVLSEVQQLAAVFTTWEPASELMRWRRGEIEQPSPELEAVLLRSEHYFRLGGGAFHPACEPLRLRWLRAEREGVVPSREEMATLARSIAELPWREESGRLRRTGDCRGADVNAFVKGWIVDAALERAWREVPGLTRIGVNAGGDLRHRGEGVWRVGVEDPLRPADNGADRIATVALHDAAIASSGLARRGFRVGEAWFGHVIDPRTGWPVEHLAQATVVAPDCGTADALATICGVLEPEQAVAFVDDWPAAEALLVTADGQHRCSAGWQQLLA